MLLQAGGGLSLFGLYDHVVSSETRLNAFQLRNYLNFDRPLSIDQIELDHLNQHFVALTAEGQIYLYTGIYSNLTPFCDSPLS